MTAHDGRPLPRWAWAWFGVQGAGLAAILASSDGLLVAPLPLVWSACALLIFAGRATDETLGSPVFALCLAASLLPGLAVGMTDLSIEPVQTANVSAERRITLERGRRERPVEVVVLGANPSSEGEVVRSDGLLSAVGRVPQPVTVYRTAMLGQLTAVEVEGRRVDIAPTLDPRFNVGLGATVLALAGCELVWARLKRSLWAS